MDEQELDELRLKIAKALGMNVRRTQETKVSEDNPFGLLPGGTIFGEWSYDERGWIEPGVLVVVDKISDIRRLPDWPRDRFAWLDLLDEIKASGAAVCVGYDTESKCWYTAYNDFGSDAANDWEMFEADSLQVSVSRAFLAWKEG